MKFSRRARCCDTTRAAVASINNRTASSKTSRTRGSSRTSSRSTPDASAKAPSGSRCRFRRCGYKRLSRVSLAGSQQKIFLRLVAELRPHWRRDSAFPLRIQEIFASNRSFGSRDRKLYRELIYTAVRFLPWIEPLLDRDPSLAAKTVAWLAADLPATHAFRAALCSDWPSCPATIF